MAEELTLTSLELRARPDLVGVDGVLYDLRGFARRHPGGAQIAGAGAYDASALYHSMHAGADPNKSALLQSYRVGVHRRLYAGHGGADVLYRYDSPFAKDALRSVRGALRAAGVRSWYAPAGFWARTAVIFAVTLLCEYRWIATGGLLWAVLVGACHAQIGLSVQHDASHGAVSADSFWNNLLAYGADWIGNSRWVWFQQHVLWHHPHTNHADLDPDASSAEPFVLFHPEHDAAAAAASGKKKKKKKGAAAAGRRKWFHAFQHWFLHLVLSLYGPSIIWNPVVLLTMQHNEHVPASVGRSAYMSTQKLHAFALRFFYVARVVLAPWLCGGAALPVAALVPGVVTGVCLTAVFVVSHNFEGSDREPQRSGGGEVASPPPSAEEKKSGGLAVAASKDEGATVSDPAEPICWYKAQAETSCTYGGRIGMLLTGGLNLQIEHHLFPRLSSWHYPVVQDAVRECCARHGVKYAYFPNLWDNMRSMFAYVKETGSGLPKAGKAE